MNKIHIIIPVLNGWTQTKHCLDALRASTYDNLEIIVVDHGSADETKEALPVQYPEVVHVLGESSLWWAGAMNLGIRTAMSRNANTIMLLNNDCYVSPETIQRLVGHVMSTGDAIVAPIQKDFTTHRITCFMASTCFLLGFPTIVLQGRTASHIGKAKLIPTKLIAGGKGTIIPVNIFKRLGMFDEANLPHYYADHDFYLRCRREGIPLFIAADTSVYVDRTRTTLASNLADMTFGQFLQTLIDRRSHRNLRDLTALFKRHYPIKGLHHIGVTLNLLRYFFMYGWERMRCALKLS